MAHARSRFGFRVRPITPALAVVIVIAHVMQQKPKCRKKRCSGGMSRILWCLIRYTGEDSCAWIHVGSNIPSELMLIICCCLLDLQYGLVRFNRKSIKVMFLCLGLDTESYCAVCAIV